MASLSACSPQDSQNESERVKQLVVRLDSPFRWVRHRAVNDLGELGSKATSAVPALLNVYLNEKEETVIRTTAVHTIGKIGTDEIDVVRALVTSLSNESISGSLRGSAATTLIELGSLTDEVTTDLVNLLSKRSSAYESFYVLSRMGPNVVPELLAQFETGNELAKSFILNLLIPHSEVDGVMKIYSSALEDEETETKLNAVRSLAKIGEPATPLLGKLINMLRETNDKLRGEVAIAIGDISSQPAELRAALQDFIEDDAQVVRLAVSLTLQEEGTAVLFSYPLFIEILSDSDSFMVLQSRMLRSVDSVLPLLLQAMGEDNEDVKLRALVLARTLGKKAEHLLPAIEKLFEDESASVRESAERAYSSIAFQSKH